MIGRYNWLINNFFDSFYYLLRTMEILIFTAGIILYIASCVFIARLNVMVRLKISGNLIFKYVAWLVFVVIYIPYSFFFPAWLSESVALWQRTQNTTMAMLFFGMAVSIFGLYKGGRINAT